MEKISLRSTSKKLISKLDDEKKIAVNNYLRTIINLPENQAFEIIASIRMAPRSMIGMTIITDDSSFYIDPNSIDEDIIIKTYPDIIENYRINNPNSWLGKAYEIFDYRLREEFDDDKTLMTIITRRVATRFEECSYNLLDLNRLEALLTSVDNEKKRFGGLRELGFTKVEADYFKNHTEVIWNFIQNNYIINRITTEEVEKNSNIAEEKTDPIDPVIPEEKNKKQPTASKIIENSVLIDEFFEAVEEALKVNKNLGTLWVKLENLGIDPDYVIYKKEKIMNLLASAEDYTV